MSDLVASMTSLSLVEASNGGHSWEGLGPGKGHAIPQLEAVVKGAAVTTKIHDYKKANSLRGRSVIVIDMLLEQLYSSNQ